MWPGLPVRVFTTGLPLITLLDPVMVKQIKWKNMNNKLEKTAAILVLIMALLQGFYAIFSYTDPLGFSSVRGTDLYSAMDADWVIIYGSRTFFIAWLLAYLLYLKNYSVLMWCALFGTVMPITDGLLAYEAQAPFKVVFKHIATIIFLLITFYVLRAAAPKKSK